MRLHWFSLNLERPNVLPVMYVLAAVPFKLFMNVESVIEPCNQTIDN